MELGELGENEILQIIESELEGVEGDDCAIIPFGDSNIVKTVDSVNPDPVALNHLPEDQRLTYLANYIVDTNVSDILSSGARPMSIVTDLELPASMTEDELKHLINSIDERAAEYGMDYVGGDITEGAYEASLGDHAAATIIGKADDESVRRASGAEPGDLVLVSGFPGLFPALGYALDSRLEWGQDERNDIIDKIWDLEPPYEAMKELNSDGIGNAGTDNSDGLGSELHKIAEKSQVGMEIYEEDMRVHPLMGRIADRTGFDPVDFVFSAGGGYQQILTVQPGEIEASNYDEFTVIGEINNSDQMELLGEDILDTRPLPSAGYENFVDYPGEGYSGMVESLIRKNRLI